MNAEPASLYLDANAGVASWPEARSAYRVAARELFGNPSSVHPPGVEAAAGLSRARQAAALALGVDPDEVVFTSGGTESNALALLGVLGASAAGDAHVVTTVIEHPSVTSTLHRLEQEGRIQVSWVSVGRTGRVEVDAVVGALREDTRLVSVIAASNETGVLQPIPELGAALAPSGVPLHTDAVQAVGKIPLAAPEWQVQLASLSGHKLGAIAGIGALVVRRGVQLAPLFVGGGQEGGRRGSTENVAGAASLAAVLPTAHERFASSRVSRDALERGIAERIAEIEIIGAGQPRLPNTSLVRFLGCPGDAVMMALDQRGVAVSTGSACSSGSVDPSPVLLGMGYSEGEAREAVRYSLAGELTAEEIERVIEATAAAVAHIRRVGAAV